MIESEFKGVRKHCGSPCHTMDQWSTQLFMCSNWLAVLPHADNFGDVLDHGHKNRTLEPCGNIITGYQASDKKQREAPPLFQWHYPKAKELMRPHTSCMLVHVGTCKHAQISALVKVTFERRNPDQKGRRLAWPKKGVRVCTQKLMLAFPQHCIVSCKGGSTAFHGNWLLPIPLAFTQESWEWKWPKWAAEGEKRSLERQREIGQQKINKMTKDTKVWKNENS